jgi:hypothetical protein
LIFGVLGLVALWVGYEVVHYLAAFFHHAVVPAQTVVSTTTSATLPTTTSLASGMPPTSTVAPVTSVPPTTLAGTASEAAHAVHSAAGHHLRHAPKHLVAPHPHAAVRHAHPPFQLHRQAIQSLPTKGGARRAVEHWMTHGKHAHHMGGEILTARVQLKPGDQLGLTNVYRAVANQLAAKLPSLTSDQWYSSLVNFNSRGVVNNPFLSGEIVIPITKPLTLNALNVVADVTKMATNTALNHVVASSSMGLSTVGLAQASAAFVSGWTGPHFLMAGMAPTGRAALYLWLVGTILAVVGSKIVGQGGSRRNVTRLLSAAA